MTFSEPGQHLPSPLFSATAHSSMKNALPPSLSLSAITIIRECLARLGCANHRTTPPHGVENAGRLRRGIDATLTNRVKRATSNSTCPHEIGHALRPSNEPPAAQRKASQLFFLGIRAQDNVQINFKGVPEAWPCRETAKTQMVKPFQ